MVLFDTQRPLPQPPDERSDTRMSGHRVALKRLPFFVCWLTFFVQDLRWNGKLANIVQQRCPPQQSSIVFGQTHLFCNYVAERTNTLRMSACTSIVVVQNVDQREHLFRCFLRVCRQIAVAEISQHRFGVAGITNPERHLQPRRSFLRKPKIHLAQTRQRDKLRCAIPNCGADDRTDDEHRQTPQHSHGQRPGRMEKQPTKQLRGDKSRDDRKDCEPKAN